MLSRPAQLVAIALLGAAGLARAQPATGPATPEDALRAEFRAALDSVALLRRPPDSNALRGYLLYPYVEAARLRYALSRVAAGARELALEKNVQDFLERNDDEPVTRELRRGWLNYLGDRKVWAKFLAEAPEALTDTALRCHALAARLAQPEQAGLRDAALALWLTHRERPAACEPAFQWLDTREQLSDAEIEQRGLFAARYRLRMPATLAQLPPERRALVEFWDRLRARPDRELAAFLEAKPALPRAVDAELAAALLGAFEQVARRDSKVARPLFKGLLAHPLFTPAQRDELKESLALGLAYDFDAGALKLFREVPENSLDAVGREWRVRAALLHREWPLALKWIEIMPPVQRQEPRWRYFRARLLQRHHAKQANEILAGVAREREYYGFLAAERLGRRPELRPQPVVDDLAVQAELAALPPVRRAQELLRCDLPELASAELRYALRERVASARAQAARLAASWGWHVPAVQMLSEMQLWDDLWLRYPRPFEPEIDLAAKDTGLPADWLYAVMRTESLYDARAVSKAGAFGLLQLLLPTAKQVAQRAGLPPPARSDLFRPEINIALGARYLREMQAGFRERFILTLAAYNAGPNRVAEWLPREPVDAEIWVENIPFNETRAYVQRTLANVVILGWRRNGEPAALLPLLTPLPALVVADAKP